MGRQVMPETSQAQAFCVFTADSRKMSEIKELLSRFLSASGATQVSLFSRQLSSHDELLEQTTRYADKKDIEDPPEEFDL